MTQGGGAGTLNPGTYMRLKYRANARQHFVEEKRQITNKWLFIANNSGRVRQAQGRPWLL